MIVVAIIGILAAIALPQFLNYVKRSKTSEATNQLKALYTNAATYYSQERGGGTLGSTVSGFCSVASSTAPHPASVGSQKVTTTDWGSTTPFDSLGFSLSDPHFFKYGVTNQTATGACGNSGPATGVTKVYDMSAHADLDDDSTFSTFSMEVGLNSENELSRAPSFDINNELE